MGTGYERGGVWCARAGVHVSGPHFLWGHFKAQSRQTDWTDLTREGARGGHASKCPNVPWARHGSAEQPVSYSRRTASLLLDQVLSTYDCALESASSNALVLPWSRFVVLVHGPSASDLQALYRCYWLDSGQKTGALIHRLRHILAMTHKMLPLVALACALQRR